MVGVVLNMLVVRRGADLGDNPGRRKLSDTKKWLKRQQRRGKLANKTPVPTAIVASLVLELGLGSIVCHKVDAMVVFGWLEGGRSLSGGNLK